MFLCFSSRESCQASQNRKIHCFWVVCLFASVFPCFCFVFVCFCFCFFCFVVCLSSLVSGFLIYFLFVCLFVYSLPMSSLLHFLFVCLFVACVFPGFWFVCLFVCLWFLLVSSLVSLSFFSSFIVRCVSLVFPQVHYCSVFCQKLHWSTHKKHCQRLAKEYE